MERFSKPLLLQAMGGAANELPYQVFSNTLSTASTPNQWTIGSSTYDASGVFTGSYSTVIDGVTVNGEWLQLQMSNGRVFGSYDLAADHSNVARMPKSFTVAVSNDGINWIGIGSKTESTQYTSLSSKSYTASLSSWKLFSYIRLVVHSPLRETPSTTVTNVQAAVLEPSDAL